MNTLKPLNLYSNLQQAATKTPQVEIFFDEILTDFPELGTKTTYATLHEIVLKRAQQLATMGIKKGDHVVIFKTPTIGTYFFAMAASYLGAIPAMISYHFKEEVMSVFASRLEDPYVIYDELTAPVVEKMENSTASNQLFVPEILKQMPTVVSQSCLELDEISYMTHTSGTTGIPKLICHSANSMGWRIAWQETVFAKMQEKKLLAFHISPVHSRFNIGVASALDMGYPLLALSNEKADEVATTIESFKPYALETHPNNFVQWSFVAKNHPEKFASLHYYHSTFDAINMATMKVFLEASKENNPVFLQVYGQSECGPMILKSHRLETIATDNGRDMGVGLAGFTEARIANQDGNLLGANEDGHIHFLSKGRALTYYKEDERFQKTVYGKWWDSGDWGMMDEKGHLYLKDRQVDLIEKVDSNLALEDLLLDHLPFLEEVVIVRDAENKPQPIVAVTKEGMNWDLWWQQVNDLPFLKAPLIWDWDQFPRTATMKVQRLAMEKKFKEEK